MKDKILDLIKGYTILNSKILREPNFPGYKQWEKVNYLNKGLIGDVNGKLEMFYNQYVNFITIPPILTFGDDTYLWKKDEIIVKKSNFWEYLNICDLIPNYYWNHNLGWIIMSDLIEHVYGKSLLDHLRSMGNSGQYYLGKTHLDILSHYLESQGEVVLIDANSCSWNTPSSVKYRKGKIVGFIECYDHTQLLPKITNFKFQETSTGKIRKLSPQPYNIAFSEDHLKVIVGKIKNDMMGIIKSQISDIENDIKSLDIKRSFMIQELDKLYEKAAYGEEILEDKFGM